MINFIKLIADPGAVILPEIEKTYDSVLIIAVSIMSVIGTGLFVLGVKKYYFDDSKQGILFIGTGIVLGSITVAVIRSM